MVIELGLWYLFPISIFISTIAMMSGIGGAVMFSPIFMLLVGLDAISAFATGLFIEIFGFSSGLIGYFRKKLIYFTLAKKILVFAIPSVIIGILLARIIPSIILKLFLFFLLLFLSFSFLRDIKKCNPKHPSCNRIAKKNITAKKLHISKNIFYSSIIGSLFFGAISSGLGEINEYNFLKKLKLATPLASGTSVFLVAISAFIGVLTHVTISFFEQSTFPISQIISVLVFVVPGVIIGAQIGVLTAQKVSIEKMSIFVGLLFFFLAIMVIITTF